MSYLPTESQMIILYIIIINIITFLLFGIDKHRARKQTRRISERVLLICALIGGSPSALYAMSKFRHKTKKISFQTYIAIILILQIFFIFYLLT